MIETSLMVEDYPEQPEPKLKCYQFEFNAKQSGYGIVYAEDIEKARELINNNEYDDIIDNWGFELEEIIDIKED